MSHREQLRFFSLLSECNRPLIERASVLEIGSYDVNGSIRSVFGGRSYMGVDLRPGPGVDVIAYGHELDCPDGTFDIALSGECFEHDPHWMETFANMCRMTRPGGLVAFSCASSGRLEHGTLRTDPDESPGTSSRGLDYYRNLTSNDFASNFPLARLFDRWSFWSLTVSCDLYFAGVVRVRPGQPEISAQIPNYEDVLRIGSLMPLRERLPRVPLRAMAACLPEDTYQILGLKYWAAWRRSHHAVHVMRRSMRGFLGGNTQLPA